MVYFWGWRERSEERGCLCPVTMMNLFLDSSCGGWSVFKPTLVCIEDGDQEATSGQTVPRSPLAGAPASETQPHPSRRSGWLLWNNCSGRDSSRVTSSMESYQHQARVWPGKTEASKPLLPSNCPLLPLRGSSIFWSK